MSFPAVALLDDESFLSIDVADALDAAVYEVVLHGDLICVLAADGSTWVWSEPPSPTAYQRGHWLRSEESAAILCARTRESERG